MAAHKKNLHSLRTCPLRPWHSTQVQDRMLILVISNTADFIQKVLGMYTHSMEVIYLSSIK